MIVQLFRQQYLALPNHQQMTPTHRIIQEQKHKRVDTLCVIVITQRYMVTVQQCGEIDSRKYEY